MVRKPAGRQRMNTGAKIDPVRYLVTRMVAFIGLTAISTGVMALPYVTSN